jgi:uncharacterized RDD family membrane protein YckC
MRLVARIIDAILTFGVSIAVTYAVGIKVFHTSTTTNPFELLLIGVIFSLLELLIFVSPFFDNTTRNRGRHDRFADTYVIKAR